MKKMEFMARLKEELLKALFGEKEMDANKHHVLFGVKMPSLAERRQGRNYVKFVD